METKDILELIKKHDFDEKDLEKINEEIQIKAIHYAFSTRKKVELLLRHLRVLDQVSLEEIAKSLYLSRRTLYRRLKKEEVKFSQILDEERKRRCYIVLKENSASGSKMAHLLGFSDSAYFYQKFEKWTGLHYKDVKNIVADKPSKIGSIFNII